MAEGVSDVFGPGEVDEGERAAGQAAFEHWAQRGRWEMPTPESSWRMMWLAAKAYVAFHEQPAASRRGKGEKPQCPSCHRSFSPIGLILLDGAAQYECPHCYAMWPREEPPEASHYPSTVQAQHSDRCAYCDGDQQHSWRQEVTHLMMTLQRIVAAGDTELPTATRAQYADVKRAKAIARTLYLEQHRD